MKNSAHNRLMPSQERRYTGFCCVLLFCVLLLGIFHWLSGDGGRQNPTAMPTLETAQTGDANTENEIDDSDLVVSRIVPSRPDPEAPKRRRLRIAQIAGLEVSVPPRLYGGTERVVYNLVEALVRRGHHVTLFAASDSQTSAQELVANGRWSSRNQPVNRMTSYVWMLEQVRQRAHQFDIMHFHTLEHLYIVHSLPLNRTLTTLHGPMNFTDSTELFRPFLDVPFVTISNEQRTHTELKLNYVATVYHGIPANLLPFVPEPSGWTDGTPYLAFVGRITESKRPEWAIQMAVRVGLPLKIAAKVDPVDRHFWETTVRPLVEKHSDLVEYIGEVNETQKAEFMGNAIALLFPIDWPEPFGLVMIEAMSCGTPVVARDMGSVREVIEHGVSGLIFETLDEGVEAVRRVGGLSRQRVRRAFERRFTLEKMVDSYERLYERQMRTEQQQRSYTDTLRR